MASASTPNPAGPSGPAASPPQSHSPVHHVNPFVLYSAVVLLLLLWTVNYLVAKEGFKEIDPLTLALMRVELAALIFVPLFFIDRARSPHRRPTGREFLYLALIAILGLCINQILFTVGLALTTVGHSSLIIAIGPVNILLLARFMGMERLSAPKVAGITISFVGVVVLAFEHGISLQAATLRGDVFTLIASLAFTGFTVLGKRVAGRFSSLTLNCYVYFLAGLILSPLTIWKCSQLNWRAVSWQGWWALVYMALGTSVVAYLMWFWALRHLAASRLGVFTYMQPVLGTLMGIYILREPFTFRLVVAGVLVLVGVMLTEWHPRWLADDEDESIEEPAHS